MNEIFEDIGGWPGVLARLFAREDLSRAEASAAMVEIFRGDASPVHVAAFVSALRVKGETVDEMAGFVQTMLELAEPLEVEWDVVDTCGTGGDGSRSINVSTIAALIVAAAGAKVCKHGGRAATSRSGSADVLEALGVVIDLGPDGVRRCIEEVGMGFCFAPRFHPAMRHAGPIRRELGVPTVFNLLGPLANPARARHQVLGLSQPKMAEKMLGVMAANGSKRSMVVFGADGLDELSTTGPSEIHELGADGSVSIELVDAVDLGFERASIDDLRGGDAHENAEALRRVLSGAGGPHRDIALLNAAAGLVVCGLAADMRSGVDASASVVDDGSAARVLDSLVEVSRDAARS